MSNKNISSSLALTEDGLVSIESIMNETVSNDKTPFGSPITVKEEVKNESLEKKKSLRKRNNSKSSKFFQIYFQYFQFNINPFID